MIASFWNQRGIVMATAAIDLLATASRQDDELRISTVEMAGLPHILTLWDSYVVMYKSPSLHSTALDFENGVRKLARRWSEKPSLPEFMSWLKKAVNEQHLQAIALVAGYGKNEEGDEELYVYQVLGDDMRRINVDNEGHPISQWVLLEPERQADRLLKDVKMRNGDQWEELPGPTLDLELFSLEKCEEMCRFMINVSHFMQTVNSSHSPAGTDCEVAVITPRGVRTKCSAKE